MPERNVDRRVGGRIGRQRRRHAAVARITLIMSAVLAFAMLLSQLSRF
ncbi:hypothetical protein [Ancylobacter sp. 3268]|nr:hypothetical protein [Ancylobacter sp. 3268]